MLWEVSVKDRKEILTKDQVLEEYGEYINPEFLCGVYLYHMFYVKRDRVRIRRIDT